MEMVNGYVFLDLTKANVYSKALKVLGTDKPVVIKDGSGSPYFVDSLTLDGTNVVITKGGKTITIANDNTITNVGEISTIMENIVDSQGNKRFIESDIEIETITNVTKLYGKVSLSGTHLMIVLAINIANGGTIANNTDIALINLPDYIKDKITPLWTTNAIENKSVTFWGNDWTSQSGSCALIKTTDGLKIVATNNITATASRNARIQFDLLIDADYSE